MKSCPVCGLIQDESCLFCPEDGTALTDDNALGSQATTAEAITEEKPSAVVLYCPACAAEYPLTFKVCPIHVVPLTKHNVLKFVPPVYKPEKQPLVQQTANSLVAGGEQSNLRIIAPSPQPTTRNIVNATVDEQDSGKTKIDNEVESRNLPPDSALEIEPPDYLSGYVALANADHNSTSQLRSHRIVAVVLVIGLSLFGIIALYTFYKNASSRSMLPDSKAATQSKTTAQQAATVYTPQAALDYKEENPEPEQQESEPAPEDKSIDNERPRNTVTLPSSAQSRRDDLAEQKPEPAPSVRQQPPSPVAAPVSASRTPAATELVLPRGTYGQVDARLMNVRSRKTPNGFRYDLTFNMQEQAGRVTQWERLAIVTRSASGISHSQAMPFYHRLGAAGTLTFTVSVEMQGRAQPDWAGRIICTSIGTDQAGKAYRASFGANVAPN
ncbi:MAG TPA: hypothetical protein VJX74_03105 [Blastocatellia bacterium]|nr:hypothetical protein [Blastocatellia bacterium]